MKKETPEQTLERVKNVASRNICGPEYNDLTDVQKACLVDPVAQLYLSEWLRQQFPSTKEEQAKMISYVENFKQDVHLSMNMAWDKCVEYIKSEIGL